MVKFTDVSLLHILILLGIPYILFYFFERFTKFDKFVEKWEGALFIFAVGGVISMGSILFQDIADIPFIYSYIIFLVFLILVLWIIQLKYYSGRKTAKPIGWIKVKMNNGDIYTGNFLESDSEYIRLGRLGSEKIRKISHKNKSELLEARELIINKSAISVLFYY